MGVAVMEREGQVRVDRKGQSPPRGPHPSTNSGPAPRDRRGVHRLLSVSRRHAVSDGHTTCFPSPEEREQDNRRDKSLHRFGSWVRESEPGNTPATTLLISYQTWVVLPLPLFIRLDGTHSYFIYT